MAILDTFQRVKKHDYPVHPVGKDILAILIKLIINARSYTPV